MGFARSVRPRSRCFAKPVVMHQYLRLIESASQRVGTTLCVGIDPVPESLPQQFSRDLAGLAAWVRLLVESTRDHAAAYKLNLAYFEAYGADGVRVAEQVRAFIPSDTALIVDAKRGDIGATVAAHATALYQHLGADAVTANPYLGLDALLPLLEDTTRFVYVLARTSNADAGEFQDLRVVASGAAQEEALYLRVAASVAARPEAAEGRLGLVVGASAGGHLALIRACAGELPFLIPGVGAQGGDLPAVAQDGGVTRGAAASSPARGLLVNIGRGITGGAEAARDPGAHLAERAAEWGSRLAILNP
ncbi:MAG: orotidine-5'-phosphate decarboxylase [Chloroflexi bacterium]|nr:MAG: orotidine-5'-phosphate decarboxylase [Chloroflexota bacterium]